MENDTRLELAEMQAHVLTLKREVRLLNRALGRKKRKVTRLRASLDSSERVNAMLGDQIVLLHDRIKALSPKPMQFGEPSEMKEMTLDQAFTEHEARLMADAQAAAETRGYDGVQILQSKYTRDDLK